MHLMLFFFLQVGLSGHSTLSGSTTVTPLVPPTPPTTHSLWSNSTIPTNVDFGDTSSNELGVKFFADNPGFIQGIKFYKAPANTGTHTGTLWTIGGINLGRVTFTGETGSGWQTQLYATQIPICGTTHYVASYFDPNGHFSLDRPYFGSQYNNAPLHGLADGADGGNGVYNNPTSNFPTSTFQSSNYWVDVIFLSSSGAVAVTTISPTSGPNGTAITVNGCNFTSGTTATLGGASATVAFVSSTQITVTAPSHANGVVDLTVTASGQTATFPQSFTYANATQPSISSVSPASGATTGGGQLQVMGSGFAAGATVTIGGNTCTSPTFVNSGQVNCTIPAGTVGFKDVVLTNPSAGGSATCSQCYQYTSISGSLLTGCVVNAGNVPSCSTPGGWHLFQVVGFDDGSMGSGVITTNIAITSGKSHTGCCSSTGQYTSGDHTVSWRSALVGATRETYVSFWEWDDPTGSMNVDWDIGGNIVRDAQDNPITDAIPRFQGGCGSNTGGGSTADIPFYWNAKTERPILWVEGGGSWPNFATWGWTIGSLGNCISPNALSGGVQGWGNWTQWEIHIKWNTPTNPSMPADGQVELFQNGVLVNQVAQFAGACSSNPAPCSNLAGLNDIATAPNRALVGGVYTKLIGYNDSALTICSTVPVPPTSFASIAGAFGTAASCQGQSPFTSTVCPNQCPPSGQTPVINRYFDDVIILTK